MPNHLTAEFKKLFIEYLSEDITRDAIESGVIIDVCDQGSYDQSEIYDFVSDRLSELDVEFDDAEIDKISDCCDVDEIIQSNVNSAMYEDQQFETYRDEGFSIQPSTDAIDAIDDLFNRD